MTRKKIGGAGAAIANPARKITAATKPQDPDQSNATAALPVVFGVLYRATGSAAYDWLVVRDCPFCGHAHRHIRFERNSQAIERSPSCAPHRVYQLRISDVVPARRRGRAA